jgi:hypothetical protein
MEPIEAIEPRTAGFEPWLFGTAAALKRALRGRTRHALRKVPTGAPGLR